MFKTFLIIMAITVGVGKLSYAQYIGDPEGFAKSPDELDDKIDDDSRSGSTANAFAAAGVSATALSPLSRGHRLHQCYVCADCPTVLANTTYKACPYSANSSKNNKCVVYSEQFRHMKKSWYIRGCASERGSCPDISRAHSSHGAIVKLNFCRECDGDKCNINGGSRPETVIAFFTIFVIPLLVGNILS